MWRLAAAHWLSKDRITVHRKRNLQPPDIRLVSLWVLGCVACAPVALRADDFFLLSSNRRAYEARIELIDLAEREIDIAYYAIDSGDVALTLLDRLRQAAGRGVQVRILVDGFQTRLPSDVASALLQAGVELRAYHPPLTGRPMWLNRRLHYKLMVVDRQAMVVGSRNLEDSHFGLKQQSFADMDALLAGDICRRAADHFHGLWNSDEVLPVERRRLIGIHKSRDYEQAVREAAARLADREAFHDGSSRCVLEPCVANIDGSYLVHDQGTDKSERLFQRQVIRIIDSAQHRVWIETPYPVLERPVKQALQRAIERGVHITLQTNSLGSIDRTAPYAAYQNDKREYQRMGVRLVEYVGQDTLHSKVVLIDESSVLIGSYNMDARSDRLNLELGVWIQDARVCQVVEHQLRHRLSSSETVQPNKLSLPEVVVGEASVLAKYPRMRFRQLWVPLIRDSL